MGNNENVSYELRPLAERMNIENFDPSLGEDGITHPVTSFTRKFPDREDMILRMPKIWPTVESSLENYGISCSLDMVEHTMTVSTTTKTMDPDVIVKARELTELLSLQIPLSEAIRILDANMRCDFIEIGPLRQGLCAKYGISEEQFTERWKRFQGPNKIRFKTIQRLTGCYISAQGRSTVSLIGKSEGLKMVRTILVDCMRNKMHPSVHIRRIRKNIQNERGLAKTLYGKGGYRCIMEASALMKTSSDFHEHSSTKFIERLHELRDSDIEAIADKDSLEVNVNAEDTLCAVMRLAPPGLASKICSPIFIRRLLEYAVENSHRKSVLTCLLSVCIEALRRNAYISEHQPAHGSTITVKNEIVAVMLDNLGDLLKLLDVSSADNMLLTTYGKLQPPLGKLRLKIVEFISVLLTVGIQATEKQLIHTEAIPRVLDLFFKYPYNNFLHHHVENIIVSCLESRNGPLVQHLLHECDLVRKILEAEKNSTLDADSVTPTIPVNGRSPPRNGNIGHLTRISNKIIQQGNNNKEIQAYLQGNSGWTEGHADVLLKRNAVENVCQWECGRPT
ncbi:uncharacterized protein LOC126786303 isoform X2 [Argentina anserina]|uniref:uncharacterized protein LOC126786303 isoform X2 n=1 Tax=Argentina anserina TaxID=57926 RepID=UPI00217627A5|nr:uncharacterized protein LOC126786303 isoform X2 [Potentilla anserina]